jgi:hypothetical protein
MATIDLSQDEANAIIGFIDLAVKAHGLNVAEKAVEMAKKIATATAPAIVSDKTTKR